MDLATQRSGLRVNGSATREPKLSVIFFLDASKTRSFSVRVHTVKVLVTCLVVFFFVMAACVFLLVRSLDENYRLTRRLRATMTTLFGYETKYDGVFEKAYPQMAPGGNGGTALGVAGQQALGAGARTTSGGLTTAGVGGAAGQAAVEAALTGEESAGDVMAEGAGVAPAGLDTNGQALDSKTAAGTKGTLPITIENPVVSLDSDSMEVSVDIRNGAKAKAEGYVWAVATYQSENGETLSIPSPKTVKVTQSGEPSQIMKTYKYSIKYHKRRTFSFDLPQGQANGGGHFISLRIGFMDMAGVRTAVDLNIEGNKANVVK